MAFLRNWTLPVQVVRVVDGDTLVVRADLGFRINHELKVRLYGIDAPEARGPEREWGLLATEHLKKLIEEHRIDDDPASPPWLMAESHKNKSDSFGRWVLRLLGRGGTAGTVDLCRKMVADGHATPANFRDEISPYWGAVPDRPEETDDSGA